MPTLFQRAVGDISMDEPRISIHTIRAMFGEIERGALTPEDVIVAYELDTEQTTDLYSLLTYMAGATDKAYFSRFIFDWLVLAERGYGNYRDESAFWARVAAEAV